MVLPATEMALRGQTRKLNKIVRKASTLDDIDNHVILDEAKEEARRAAKAVLSELEIIATAGGNKKRKKEKKRKTNKQNNGNAENDSSSSHDDDDSSDASSSKDSVLSAEIAIHRGSMRALSEGNEQDGDSSMESSSLGGQDNGFQLTVITEAETEEHHSSSDSTKSRSKKKETPQHQKKSRNFLQKFVKKFTVAKNVTKGAGVAAANLANKTASPLLSTKNGIGKECWMCGCCGKVFATYDIADRHEQKCLQEIVDGYDQDSNTGIEEEEDGECDDRKPPPKPLGFPKEVLQRRTSIEQPMSPDFAAAREIYLSERAATAVTPKTKNTTQKRDDTLMADVGLGEAPEPPIRTRVKSVYASAKSVQPGTPSPWESTQKGSMDPTPDEQSSKGLPSTEAGHARVSFLCDDPSKIRNPSSVGMRSTGMTPRRRLSTSFSREIISRQRGAQVNTSNRSNDEPRDILLTRSMRHEIIMTDEALVNSVQRAATIILTAAEMDAEKDLGYLAADKLYYDEMGMRASKLKAHPMSKFRTDGDSVVSKIQNKFVDAWQLIKDGDNETEIFRDQYEKKNRGDDGADNELEHDSNTHYVNVVVRHSVKVVSNEIERLAGKRWKDQGEIEGEKKKDNFEQFRKFAHVNLIKLAKLALSVDFTPRKVSVQLSNDLYRLMAPQLKRRGVIIETEIEYRVGPYFVLAVNVKSIEWSKLIKYSNRLVTKRYHQWVEQQARRDELREELATEEGQPTKNQLVGGVRGMYRSFRSLFLMTKIECLAQFLAWMYYVHWTISTPLCMILYKFFSRSTVTKYILTSVADEIFSYVEEKGMEMEIGIVQAEKQAAFMLSALREVREGTKALKNQKDDTEDKGIIVGPLLGPAIKSDKGPVPSPPPGFEMPENLENVNFEIDLPVGFKRIRWAMLSAKSNFSRDALFVESKYENVIMNDWTRHNDEIGSPNPPTGDVKEEDFVGAEREGQYLMPKSGFVGANTAYDTHIITAYNDYCFCVKKRTLSPEVPYGSTFVTWTQMIFTNTGNDTCHLVCSVEAEFPNGPPMISGQIKSGMRAGTALSFVLMGEIIIRYAEEYP